jgi:Kef-type K+ transport system membrane component KefB
MKQVLAYSTLLVLGLVLSQFIPSWSGEHSDAVATAVRLCTMLALSFIMIRVGFEFDIDKSNMRQYGWDYVVAATAAAFPWIFCALYFIYVILPASSWVDVEAWKESLLAARFSSPTSAGVLFSMLAAAGLAATWLFKKARILAIFDDLDTVLLMIPLKMLMVGFRWQLAIIAGLIAIQLWVAWKYLHRWALPITWKPVTVYALIIVAVSEAIYRVSKTVDPMVPIHIEVLLPAFVLGCIIARGHGQKPADHVGQSGEDSEEVLERPSEHRASTVISGLFMLLVGLSMPALDLTTPPTPADAATAITAIDTAASTLATPATPADAPAPTELMHVHLKENTPPMGWGTILLHVLGITLLANLGKMFPALCYRREASRKVRLALAIGMWPRGEVGAGVLVVSLSYGIGGPIVTIAMLSLALNLVLTGVFILIIRRLIADDPDSIAAMQVAKP